jgi:Glycosyl transferase family 2/Methyltransferase domain
MQPLQPPRPDVSVVVVIHNMAREAARTLLSLSTTYQRNIAAEQYEIIVVDNGSTRPLGPEVIDGLAGNFRLIRLDPAPPSPAHAVNVGIAEARGEIIGVMIDGARIVTPGLLHFARHGARLHPRAVVATLGWYLGFDFQRWSMRYGYDQTREDALLQEIGWPQDGYRLFEIATMDESCVEGWFFPIAESNALFMRRELWDALGGMDERFDAPGGGLVNLDTFIRAVELPDAQLVMLLGEGTFHQIHGGVATNLAPEQFPESFKKWDDQYEKIRGHRFHLSTLHTSPTYLGVLPRPALAHFARAAIAPVHTNEPALGSKFNPQLWSLVTPTRPADPLIAALVDLAHQEFRSGRYSAAASIARLIRSRAPNEREPQRLLSLIGYQLDQGYPLRAEYYISLGEAYRILGEKERAEINYRAALKLGHDLPEAHVGLSKLRMPGDDYLVWLERFHAALAPDIYLEIGVERGNSLALARPPTLTIGVDPKPNLNVPLNTETHIFIETSDAFFARRGPDSLLAGRPLGLAFIDGLHLFEQTLNDFMHVEGYCSRHSVILLHDTVPLDEVTQSRVCTTRFYTGDVWKIVLCLKHYRPDLDIFTIATPWTGLTVVTGLDAESRILPDHYDDAVARFIDTPYEEIKTNLDDPHNLVSNDWPQVEARLKARGIPTAK